MLLFLSYRKKWKKIQSQRKKKRRKKSKSCFRGISSLFTRRNMISEVEFPVSCMSSDCWMLLLFLNWIEIRYKDVLWNILYSLDIFVFFVGRAMLEFKIPTKSTLVIFLTIWNPGIQVSMNMAYHHQTSKFRAHTIKWFHGFTYSTMTCSANVGPCWGKVWPSLGTIDRGPV